MTCGRIFAIGVLVAGAASAHAQSPPDKTVPVTADNFIRAESDLYFGNAVKEGGFGKFHRRCRVFKGQVSLRAEV